MSLINRMLRDLSARQPGPAPGSVMTGIQLPQEQAPRGGMLGRLGMLAVLVVAFTGLFWFVFGPKPAKIPQPRGLPADAAVASGAPAAAPADATTAPAPTLQMDTQLAQAPPASTPAAAPAPQAAPPAPRPSIPARAPRAPVKSAAAPKPAAPSPSGEELYATGRRALERGDDVAAETALVGALAAKPDLHYAREDLGNLYVRQGRFDDAERTLSAGLASDPAFVGYRRLAARVELARDRPAAAVEVLLRGVPPVERDVDYHALLASGYQRIGRHEDASREYRDLARVQPDEANWYAGYGLSRDALDDVAGALAAYTRARQLGGLDPRVLEHINQRTAALQADD
jgi:Flp pilus assembly protein TadD